MTRPHHTRGTAGAIAAIVIAVLPGGCGDDGDVQSANVLSVEASEYAFTVSGEPTAGSLTIHAENTGSEIHVLAMSRLVGDSTLEDVRAALDAAGPDVEPDFEGILEDDATIDDLGGELFPGTSLSITGSGIEAGSYVLICSLPNPDGDPHYSLGMLDEFEITDGQAVNTPDADATYTSTDEGLEGPQTLEAGQTELAMVNDAATSREIGIIKLHDGFTFDDADAFFAQGPPDGASLASDDNPFEFLSFLYDADQDRFVSVNLTPGTWVIMMHDPEHPFEGSPADDPNAVIVQVNS